MSIKKVIALIMIVAVLASFGIAVFAEAPKPTSSDKTIEDPAELLGDSALVNEAEAAVAETKQDIQVMGMSVYILIRAIATIIGLIVGVIIFVQYMMAGKNTNKRADVIGGIGHFAVAFAGIFGIGWLVSLIYKFATGMAG